jgi:ferrochelatase
MGGPDSLDSIEPFLKNLFSDRDIIDFKVGNNLQNFIADKIAKKRSKIVKPDYNKIGGASPQIKYLNDLLKKIEKIYQEEFKTKLVTSTGMCYYHPFIEDSVRILQENKYDNAFIMTMYPQYSYTTTGVCLKKFNNSLNIKPSKSNYKIIPFWHLNKKYNQCIIDRILDSAKKLNQEISNCHILFSAHSLPEYTIEKGDIYLTQLKEQINHIIENLNTENYSLAFQSRTGPMKWISPETSEKLEELYKKNIDNIIVVPISFVSDHIETLIELDEIYIKNIKEKGINITRIESLNDSEDFAESIISIIRG